MKDPDYKKIYIERKYFNKMQEKQFLKVKGSLL